MSEIILTLFLTHMFLVDCILWRGFLLCCAAAREGRSSDAVVWVAGWELVGLQMIYLRATLFAALTAVAQECVVGTCRRAWSGDAMRMRHQ